MEKTKRQIEKALKYCEKIANSQKYDPAKIEDSMIQNMKEVGVYLWRSKREGEIAYVGRGLGKGGLHQRIVKQHLRDSYTKSVFRKQISKEFNLNLKEGSALYIKENFEFSFVTFEEEDMSLRERKCLASFVEKFLIYEFNPKYNRTICAHPE